MPTYYVPVAVKAATAEDAENYVEGLIKGRKPAESSVSAQTVARDCLIPVVCG